MKRKDALTDLVEHAQDTAPVQPVTQPSDDRQVVNQQGETITLGQKPTAHSVVPNKGILLELSETGEKATETRQCLNLTSASEKSS
ncbi:MAG: hypothetical protein P4M11_09820 [Candidatus Pacebacteria bacterium]|nr:hypothetical protein [Candidatus Paceibacterota bacterium]